MHPVRLRLLALLVLPLLLAVLVPWPAPASRAAGTVRAAVPVAVPAAVPAGAPAASYPDTPAEVVVASLTPAVPRPGGELVVAGEIVNRSGEPLEDVQVRLRVSRNALARRGSVSEIATGSDVSSRLGVRVEPTLQDVTGELAPGARARFEIRLPVDELRLDDFGVYVLGVEALAADERAALTRTFLPWVPQEAAYLRSRLTWAWPLVDRPHRDADGVFLDESLAGSLRAGGRLHRLLTGAAGARLQVAWFIDPMLLQDVEAMADPAGYSVRTRDGTAPGTEAAVATAWLAALRAATTRAEVHALPYADPDAVAVTRAGQGGELGAATGTGAAIVAEVLGRRVRSDVAWPVGGTLDYATGRALFETGVRATVLRDSVLPAESPPPYTPDGRAVLPLGAGRTLDALLYDERLSALASTPPAGAGQHVLTRQRLLAESAMVVAERPGVARTLLLAPERRWDPTPEHLAAVLQQRDAPWLEPATLGSLRAQPPPALDRAVLDYPADAGAAELPGAYLEQVGSVQRDVGVLQQLVGDGGGPAGQLGQLGQAVARLRSSAYRQADRGQRSGALGVARRNAVGEQRRVRLVPASVTLGDRRGTIPVTVINDFDAPVQVRLALDAGSPKLLLDTGIPVTVLPRRNRTVLVPARAEANGMVPVAAQLATAQGTTYGEPVQLRVRVFFVPAVGAYLTAGAAALLFVRAALTVRRRLRASRPSPA